MNIESLQVCKLSLHKIPDNGAGLQSFQILAIFIKPEGCSPFSFFQFSALLADRR